MSTTLTPIPHLPTHLLLPRLLGIAPSRRLWKSPGNPAYYSSVSLCRSYCELCSSKTPLTGPPPPPPGGWALNMKDLKLLQTIGKGEFGGERVGLGAL